ncbi:MarR family transcriptional regulator, partial [Candidatus Aerophobetes bacterium]|nr:MarR family transcriptional regulator [Candidatus Aerophobetes bacterium]
IMEDEIQRQADLLDRLMSDIARIFGMKEMEKVVDVDLNFHQLEVLRQIYLFKEPMMSQLGEACGIQLSTLTRIVDKLVQKNFVTRKFDPSDRRVIRVTLTPYGDEVVRKVEKTKKEKIMSVLRYFSHSEREKFLQMLQVLHQRICNEEKRGKR